MSNTPKKHTDSSIVEYHEDGTWTETTTVTHHPATKAQMALAWTGVGVLALAPLFPLAAFWARDKMEDRRNAKRANLKAVPETESD